MELREMAGYWLPPPPIFLEGRVWLEYLALMRDPIWRGLGAPKGGGRPVMLIPGFLAGDRSLDPLRRWLDQAGFRTLRSGIDLNAQASVVLIDRISRLLQEEFKAHRRKIIMIGQSRGGSLAFSVSRRHPELVERVIALGSPLAGPLDVHPYVMVSVHTVRVLHALRHGMEDVDKPFNRELRLPAKVPTTSIYSRTDGIVHWKACLRDDTENIEVPGSHIGMGVNAQVYRELAKLLRPRSSARAG